MTSPVTAQRPLPGQPQPDLNVKVMCKECKNPVPNIVEEFASGDLVCGDCGLVLGDRIIDTRSEWRTFANDDGDDPSRVGAAANPLLSGSQLDTVISKTDGGSGTARDLSKIQGRSSAVKGERNLVQAYKEISAMCDAIGLPKLIGDIAKQLYKRVEDEKLLRGKPNESIIAACIFIACRQENVPRTFKEICALTQVPKKEIGRCFKALARVLETNVNTMGSEDLMSRFCSNLSLPMEVQKAAVDLTKKAKEVGTLAGKSPVSIAAACIYLISNLYQIPKTTRDIAPVTGVSEVTIKNAYRYLYNAKEQLIDLSTSKSNISFESLPHP
ncbi:TFIIB-domain-containing protein [Basidiobolus meristosporus CBS 931.73]|uniref:Transcription initiation factor IIB n=1 Tax=Basidiobolus meristosporus CBS 931.73 TaxID=1314790 RepID=A0A1Y1Z0T8_9FUNG|nr:TFIIB-domain-containing protein [Basidiobolus meristosporus CBS 931.73]|eukprot:ORY03902.1 TFIIB-domain-containing protein [Basidiobolus meristosporus CBS 931.73]